MSFLKDAFIYALGSFLSKGISFFLLPFYTRIFTPDDYGAMDLISMSIAILSMVFSCQLDQGVARFLISAKSQKSKKSYATVGLFHYLIIFGLLTSAIFMAKLPIARYLFNRSDLADVIGLAAIFMFTEIIFYFFQNQLKWEFKSKEYSIISIFRVILNTALVVLLAGVMHLKLTGVYLGSIATNIILLGPLYYFTQQSIDITLASAKRWRKMMVFSAPLIFSSLAIYLFQYCDRFFIQKMISLSELGVYSVAVKISSVTLILFSGFTLAFGPYVYQNFKRPEAIENIRKIFNVVLTISGLIILTLSCFTPEILIVMTTQSFYKAYTVIPIIVTSNVIYYIGMDFSVGISLAKKNHYYIYINSIGLILNIILNSVLIPKLGVFGAAMATFTSLILITSASIYLSQKVYFIPYEFQKIFILSIWISLCVGISVFYGSFSISLVWIVLKILMILGYCLLASLLFRNETKIVIKKLKELKKRIN